MLAGHELRCPDPNKAKMPTGLVGNPGFGIHDPVAEQMLLDHRVQFWTQAGLLVASTPLQLASNGWHSHSL